MANTTLAERQAMRKAGLLGNLGATNQPVNPTAPQAPVVQTPQALGSEMIKNASWIGVPTPKTTTTPTITPTERVSDSSWIGTGKPVTPKPPVVTPKPTVATATSPIVDKETIGTTPTALNFDRNTFLTIGAKEAGKLTPEEKEYLRKIQLRRSMGDTFETIFGEPAATSTNTPPLPTAPTTAEEIEKKRLALSDTTADLTAKKQAELDAKLAKRKAELEALGEKRKQATQSIVSSSGFGRSTFAATQMDDIQKDVNDMIAAEQASANLEIALFKAQQEGADEKTIASMQETLNTYNDNVKKLEFTNAENIAKLNAASKIKGQEALDTFLSALTTKTKEQLETEGFDEKLSSRVGYAVDKFGRPLMIDGKKLEFTGETGISEAVESYASEIFKGNANISSVPDDKRDAVINRVAGMRTESGVATSSVNEFRAEKILKTILKRTIDKQKDGAYMSLVGNMLDKGYSEDQIYNELGSADLKKTDFVSGNQKLFDDMQKDATNYSDIDRSFNSMKQVFEDSKKKGDTESVAATDQALVILFNKLLDPGSVVREGEFDRTAEGQALIDRAQGYFTRLKQGGAGIGPGARADMVRIAEVLHEEAKKGLNVRKQTYQDIASDLGGDPAFVKKYFEGKLNVKTGVGLSDDEATQIKNIFGSKGTTTGTKTYSSSSGKTFKLDFSTAGQTAPKTEKVGGLANLTSERGASIPYTGNVGKDLNNPGNLVAGGRADKFAKGYVTVTGNDGVTRKFLVFDSKDQGYKGVEDDLQAKIDGNSRVIKPTDTLSRLLDVWVGGKGAGQGYKQTVARLSGYDLNKPISGLEASKILKGIRVAEGA